MIKQSAFKPAWWLKNQHLQTLWPSLFRRNIKLKLRRERFELADGDFVDLDWAGVGNGPIVLVLHGLGGSSQSPYAQGIIKAIVDANWRGVLMNFRGCSGEPNRLPRYYHSGETGDLAEVVALLRKRFPGVPIAAVGYSLGGSVLLKWLGETREQNLLTTAVAVSVPFELYEAANQVNQGFAKFYQWVFLRDLRKFVERKFKLMNNAPIDLSVLASVRTLMEFDTKVTAPLHGFADALDYYNRSSCRSYLKYIGIPTLILHANDDPLINRELQFHEQELSSALSLEVSAYGGHVGFIGGNVPFYPEYWLEQRIPAYLKEVLE